MKRRRIRFTCSALLVSIVGLTACSDSAENGIEQLVEQQGGGDIDIDADDGGFSIETEDGSMTVDEDGNFVVTDDNGEVITGQASGDDGDIDIETDDGSFSVNAGTGIPDEWPDEIPLPDGLDDVSSSVTAAGDELVISLTGQTDDDFVDDYAASLEASGFEQTATSQGAGATIRTFEAGLYTVALTSSPVGDQNQATVTVYTSA